MKKNFRLIPFAVLAITAVMSCSELKTETPLKDYFYNDDPAAMTFYASTQVTMPETRTSLGTTTENAAPVNWNAGDAISVFDANNTNVQFTTATDGQPSGTFAEIVSGTFVNSSEDDAVFYSIYPYSSENSIQIDNDNNVSLTAVVPDVQHVVHKSFADKSNVAVGKTDDEGNIKFQNLCGYIRVYVNYANGITSLKISGNNNEILAGKVNVSWNKDGEPVYKVVEGQGKTSVTISYENGSDTFKKGEWYYIPVLPQVFENGLTLEMTCGGLTYECGNSPVIKKAFKRTSAEITINRNVTFRLFQWDTNNIWRTAMLYDMEGDENTTYEVGTKVANANYYTDYVSSAGGDKDYYTVAANPHITAVNPSSKVLKVDATGYTPADKVVNGRLGVNFTDNMKAVNNKGMNALRAKVYISSSDAKKYFPRVQLMHNKFTSSKNYSLPSTIINRPIMTPSYINGNKMDVKILSYGNSSNNAEEISSVLQIGNHDGSLNKIDQAWLESWDKAINKDEWNDMIWVWSDISGNKSLPNTVGQIRIHPFFPADPANDKAYYADEYGVMYLDDIQMIRFGE